MAGTAAAQRPSRGVDPPHFSQPDFRSTFILQFPFLVRRGRRIDPGIKRTSKFRGQFTVVQAGIFSGSSGDLCGKKIMIGPSLSVVHTVLLRRRKLAPALSSPPKHTEPSIRPGTNHLKPTGTSCNLRPFHHAIDHAAFTNVLPTAEWEFHSGELVQQVTDRYGRESGSGSSSRPLESQCHDGRSRGRCPNAI